MEELGKIEARYPDNDPIDNDVRALVAEVRRLLLQVRDLTASRDAYKKLLRVALDGEPVAKIEEMLAGMEKPVKAAPKFIGVARCSECATEGLLREDGVIEDGRFYTKPIVCEVCKPVKQNCAVLIGDGSECGYALPCPIKGHSEKREELCPKYICPLCYHHINSEEHALCVKERAAHHGLTGE